MYSLLEYWTFVVVKKHYNIRFIIILYLFESPATFSKCSKLESWEYAENQASVLLAGRKEEQNLVDVRLHTVTYPKK